MGDLIDEVERALLECRVDHLSRVSPELLGELLDPGWRESSADHSAVPAVVIAVEGQHRGLAGRELDRIDRSELPDVHVAPVRCPDLSVAIDLEDVLVS